MQIDEVSTAIDEYLEGDMLVYVFEIDENQVSLSDIESLSEYFKRALLDNPSITNNMEQFNVGIIYRYVGNISGEKFDVYFR